MRKTQKQELVTELKEVFEQAVIGVLIGYKGMTVAELTTLRKDLYEKGGRFKVLKNTLTKLASQNTPFEEITQDLVQNRAFVYSTEDPVSSTKVLTKAAEDNEKISLIKGVLVTDGRGEVLDEKGITAVASLPSKEELIVKLLYLMNAPITNFIRTLNEIPASFVRVLQAISDSKE